MDSTTLESTFQGQPVADEEVFSPVFADGAGI
jgi:hypothetical protein